MELEIVRLNQADQRFLRQVDAYILTDTTNGEFINTYRYLSYHSPERFKDDSVAVVDKGSREVRGIMMAACLPCDDSHIISHPGTTFSGIVLNSRMKMSENKKVLERCFAYYEEKYKIIEIRIRPSIYDNQPMDWINYFLMNRGYQYGMMGLANVINIKGIEREEEQFLLYDAKRRNQVKKVLKGNNYIFHEENEIDCCYWSHMNQNLKERYDALTTHTYGEIKSLYEKCQGNIGIYSVHRNTGEYGAFALIYKFKNVFHTQYLDLNYEYSSEYPHLFLIHNLIQIARKEGYSYFSFGASTENRGKYLNEGLYHYKEGYGGGSILLPVYIKDLNK